MIWLTVAPETSAAVGKIKEILENELQRAGVDWRREESRPFRGHITLARFEITALKNLPELNEPFTENFESNKIDLMKSTLRREGALYEILFSV
jgi:2'-5' RNA ligase